MMKTLNETTNETLSDQKYSRAPYSKMPGTNVAAAVKPREPQVTLQNCIISERLDALDKHLSELQERLNPVLRMEAAGSLTNQVPPETEVQLVMMAEQLRLHSRRIENVISWVINIMERLEV